MNREIKFRVWDRKCMSMHRVKELSIDISSVLAYGKKVIDVDFRLGFNEYDLMQFSGFKDENGKEIYEGDIIDKKFKWVVSFEDGAFHARNKYAKAYLLPEIIRKRRIAGCPISVIGNIYETPKIMQGVA